MSTDNDESRGVERRSFMKSALVIGGSSALSTTLGLYGMPDTAAAADPPSFTERANRQHAW
ncbi:MAG: Tat pathway signal protein, partial [Haloferacaceae archaeon]